MWAMTNKIKDNILNINRWYLSIMATISSALLGLVLYFVVKLTDKIDYSYKFNVVQEQINVAVQNDFNMIDERFKEINHDITKQDTRQDIISERLYSVEALLRYKPQQTSINN